MGEPVIIYGKSGAGKTRSIKFFGEAEVYVINIEEKKFPFSVKEKTFKYVSGKKTPGQIINALKQMPTKTAIIDDAGYLMSDMFMSRHRENTGSKQFDMYNDIADGMNNLFNFIKFDLPDDVIVYLVFHEEKGEDGEKKILTIGKLLDQKVNLVGKVTICLYAMARGSEHIFVTNSDGTTIAKSPEGMFDFEIENNLKFVDTKIREFYGIENNSETERKAKND